ncbi:MAG: hypothetical protein RJA07_933 [Bacteroidota bacterium]|jgi:DNA invertase Pin-like site-specific DNA recombinase
MNTTPKKAVIYCRVSTKEQVEEGNSLFTQEKTCKEYALKNGYDISAVFIEQGESAKTQDRTELQNLLKYCADKKNGIEAVISYKIDRISRNTDDYSQIRILLKRYGVEIKSTSEYFENTPAGRFMENIIANVAQFDNDVRTERSVNGMRDAMREGRYVWQASIGYSNAKVDGKTSIVQNEMATYIKQAFELLATGNHTIVEVHKIVTDAGLRTPKGKLVSRSYFPALFSNPLYMGIIKKFGETHKGLFEPIVSEGLFTHVQNMLKRRNKQPRAYTRVHPDFPLRNFISHPTGLKISGAWSQGNRKKYAYYRFLLKERNIPKVLLEAKFKEFMNQFCLNEDVFSKLVQELKAQFPEALEKKEVEIKQLQARIVELQEQENIITEKNLQGVYGDRMTQAHLGRIEQDILKINAELYQQPTQERKNIEALVQTARECLFEPANVWEKFTLGNKVIFQKFVFPSGVVLENENLRTPEICSIFKVKDVFLAEKSAMVPYNNITTNTPQIANELFWKQVIMDLEKIEEICKGEERLQENIVL